MSYTAWSVVFGEQPTAAKWNILGANDASFHDGTGIDDEAILIRHTNFDKSRAIKDGANIQSIPNDTQTILTWPTEDYDIGGLHSTGVNPSRFTCQTAGWHLIWSNIRWGANTTGIRESTIRIGGTAIAVSQASPNSTGFNPSNNLLTLIELAQGDFAETYVYQNSGGALDVLASSLGEMGMALVG